MLNIDGFMAIQRYARQQRRAYFAAASFADAQVGRVLDAVEAAALSYRTVVVLFGDRA